jgi:hypothetical protein
MRWWYRRQMRTTIAIDDDVFAFAKAQAQREQVSLGEIVSRLARQGIRTQDAGPSLMAKPKSRLALLPARDEVITTEHVRALMDREGI